MNVEQVNQVLSILMTFRHDRVLLQWEHLDLTWSSVYTRTGDLGRTWPASVLENSVPSSECQCSDVWGLELRWLLWAACSSLRGLRGPPRVRDAVGSESLPLPGSPSLGHGGSSGGLPGNHSNFPAHSGWVGTQVHLLSWFQGSGKKSTGSRWGCCCDLLPVDSPQKRIGLLPVLQPSSPVSFTPQWDKKDRACQNQGSVFNMIMTAIETVNITQNQREKRRTSLGQCGERRPTLHFFLPSQEVTGM